MRLAPESIRIVVEEESYLAPFEPSQFVREFKGKVFGWHSDDSENFDEPDVLVGSLEFLRIGDVGYGQFSTYDVCDDHSAELEELHTKLPGFFERDTPIMLIQSIEIKPEYRGRQLGQLLICWMANCYHQAIVLLKSQPEKQRLKAYWERMGFRHLKETDYLELDKSSFAYRQHWRRLMRQDI